MNDLRNELLSKSIEHHNKYIYYLISLSVAGIGFGVQNTTNYHNTNSLILILWISSIISWSISVISGFYGLEIKIQGLGIDIFKIDFTNEETKKYPNKNIFDHIDMLFKEKTDVLNSKAFKWFSIQKWSFLIGCLIYVIFHLIKINTP